ncbi:hypothetical protein SRABI106_04355 [Rahnella aquatilis]|nr:hypothetical protein SRABI106_04355 [Rahnella aquatilis]
MAEIDGNVKARQRNSPDNFIDMGEFGFLSTHEFTAGGRIVKQIQHFNRRALRMRRRFDRHRHIPSFGIGLPGFILLCGARCQNQARYRADTGQRFATKSEAQDCFQIIKTGDFTGGMTCQRQRQIVFANPAAVVANADKLGATAIDININTRRARIKAVFHQFLHHGSRSFDNFARCYLVSKLRRQYLDRHSGSCGRRLFPPMTVE